MDFSGILDSPIWTSLLIVAVILLIMFSCCPKYFKRRFRVLFRIGIYSVLITCTLLFLHDRMLSKSFEGKVDDKKLLGMISDEGPKVRGEFEFNDDDEDDNVDVSNLF